VALAAVLIQHGLDEALVADALRAPGWRGDGAWLAPQRGGHHRCARRRRAVAFVAADAPAHLTRHDASEAAHRLQAAVLPVEQLEVNRLPGRDLKIDGPVGLDRHFAEDPFHRILLDDGNRRAGMSIGLFPSGVGLVIRLEDPQILDRATRQVGHPLTDVGGEQDSRLVRLAVGTGAGPHDSVGVYRGALAWPDRDRVKDVIGSLIDEFPVPIHIHQIQAEPSVQATRRDQEVLLGQGHRRAVAAEAAGGMVTFRLTRIHRPIAGLRPRQIAGHLGQPVGKVEALRGINDADRTAPPIVVTHAAKHDPAAARNLLRLGGMVRPDTLVTPEHAHPRAVLIDGPELLRAPQCLVGVFPP